MVISVTEHQVEVVDKLSTTSVVFFRSERETRMHVLIWSLKCLLCMLRGMLGSVKGEKSENPKGEGKLGIGKWGINNKINIKLN